MPMVLEAWPGGRWYRDLGNDNGHFWAHVQAIKRPTLLEFSGPLMMSYPVANNVQYRLSEETGGTLIKFRHSGFGLVQDDHRKGVSGGWGYIHGKIRERAEGLQEVDLIRHRNSNSPQNTRRSYVDYTSIDRRIHCTGASRGV